MSVHVRYAGLFLFVAASQAFGAIQSVSIISRGLAYDPARQTLYATVPSTASNGNSLTPINPFTATLGTSIFVGSEPGKVAISQDGAYAYVGLSGAPSIRRVDLNTQTADLQFALGADGFLGPYYAEDIEVMPGNSHAIAVSRRNVGYSPRHEGVAIYDDGVKRTAETPGHTGSNVIEFGPDASTLYGYNNETTDFGFRTMSVTAGGVATTNSTAGLISGFGTDFDYGGGKAVSTSGRVIDAASRVLLGTLNRSGPVAVAPDGKRAFVLNSGSIYAFDLNTFLSLGSIPVPGLTETGADLTLWGPSGLAFRTSDKVYLVTSPLIPEPASAALVAAAFALARRRRA